MTNQEILENAIQKAIDGGWFDSTGYCGYIIWQPVNSYEMLIILENKNTHEKRQVNVEYVLFNHDFAKALWDEAIYTDVGLVVDQHDLSKGPIGKIPIQGKRGYKYHLQQMVIAEDPIKYLGENI